MKKVFMLISALLLSAAAFSQSAEKITDIIDTDTVTYGQISYIVSTYCGYITDDKSYEDALKVMVEKKQFPSSVKASDPIAIKNISYVYALATNLKGGLWYSAKPSARYAMKEYKSLGIIPETTDPSKKISGRNALDLFSNCASLTKKNSE